MDEDLIKEEHSIANENAAKKLHSFKEAWSYTFPTAEH